MNPPETQNQSEIQEQSEKEPPEPNQSIAQAEPFYMNPKKPSQPESATQIQRDSVITSEDLPHPLFRLGVTIAFLLPLLLLAAIYYGILKI